MLCEKYLIKRLNVKSYFAINRNFTAGMISDWNERLEGIFKMHANTQENVILNSAIKSEKQDQRKIIQNNRQPQYIL
jgi:hypothetical protein